MNAVMNWREKPSTNVGKNGGTLIIPDIKYLTNNKNYVIYSHNSLKYYKFTNLFLLMKLHFILS